MNMTAPRSEGLMTLTDIAVLAQVQRPVVSMWRHRPHAVAGAFPNSVARVDGVERFDPAAVVAWLTLSGRGNNPQVALDAALHARPPVPTPDGWALVTALLAVRAGGALELSGLDREDLLDLADEVDPDDLCAYAEIAVATADELYATAGYVDAVVGAAFGAPDALRHLDRDPSRFGVFHQPVDASAEVLDVIGAMAHALATTGAGTSLPLADPTGCGADLVLAGLRASGLESWGSVAARPVVANDSESVRWAVRDAWRRLVIHGVLPEVIDTDDEGHVAISGSAVVVAGYPHSGAPAMTPERLLDAVDDVFVQLGPEQRAVVLGPASVLTDALGGRGAARARRQLIDTGRLRALVRFGPGSTVGVPQRHLALWVIGPEPLDNFRQGRTAVADVSTADLGRVRDDLVADVLAAIEDRPVPGASADESQGRAHAFRVARYQRTFAVLAREGDLVPRDVRADPATAPMVDAGAALDRARSVGPALPGVPVRVENAPEGAAGQVVTIRELLADGAVKVVRGTRLDPEEVRHSADLGEFAVPVTVVGATEMSGAGRVGGRSVDLYAFTVAHPNAERTEPGDVVFCAGPRPGAWVDARGGTVVEYPARALRVAGEWEGHRVIPQILAADVERGEGTQWRSFPARLVPVVTADTLTEVLDSVAVARRQAQQRVDDLTDVIDLLADGAVGGQLTAMMNLDEPEGH